MIFSRAKKIVSYARWRFHSWEWRRKMYQLDPIFHYIGMRDGFVVQGGPFVGMYYLSQVGRGELLHGSAFFPKLLGTYEAELHDVIAQFATKSYTTVVNVGCGEGYYAVGLARMLQQAHIYAFDIDQQCQEWCTKIAHLNSVAERVTIAGQCNLEQLRTLTTQSALLVVDCEGNELDLLQPDVLPGLRLCDILVEFHDFINPIISHTICERFAATHDITIINSKERNPVGNPALRSLSVYKQHLAVDEFRPTKMQWAFMRAKAAYQGDSKSTTIGREGDEKELIIDSQ